MTLSSRWSKLYWHTHAAKGTESSRNVPTTMTSEYVRKYALAISPATNIASRGPPTSYLRVILALASAAARWRSKSPTSHSTSAGKHMLEGMIFGAGLTLKAARFDQFWSFEGVAKNALYDNPLPLPPATREPVIREPHIVRPRARPPATSTTTRRLPSAWEIPSSTGALAERSYASSAVSSILRYQH